MPGGRLQDKVAIVTGASSGIGRSICLHYAKEGALLVCADLQPNALPNKSSPSSAIEEGEGEGPLAPTHDLITASGGHAIFLSVDVRVPTQVENLIKTAAQHYGRLDIMVNNAGIGVSSPKPIWDLSPAAWDEMQAVNSTGVFLGTKYASAQMLSQAPHPVNQEQRRSINGAHSRGWIINVASILGLVGQASAAEYCAAKGAVVNFTRAAAMDCAPHGIHVNAFAPGYTATAMTADHFGDEGRREALRGMHPLRGLGRAEDLARVCVFLASEDAGWVSGVTLPVDGGFLAGRS